MWTFSSYRMNVLLFKLILIISFVRSHSGEEAVSEVDMFQYNDWDPQMIGRNWAMCPTSLDHRPKNLKFLTLHTESFNATKKHPDYIGISDHFIDEMSVFYLRYGEIEWKAKISHTNNVLNVFRVGWLKLRNNFPPPRIGKNINEERPAIQLVVQRAENSTSCIAELFSTDNNLSIREYDYVSRGSHSSNITNSKWVLAHCEISENILSDEFYVYKLRWTPTELIWFINNVELCRLNDKSIIPSQSLPVSVYIKHNNLSCLEEGTLLIDSITVHQNKTVLDVHKPHFPNVYREDFKDGESGLHLKWNFLQNNRCIPLPSTEHVKYLADSSVHSQLHCLRFEKGVNLQLMLGKSLCRSKPNLQCYGFGRVESSEDSSFLYGEVEWKMRVNPMSGIRSILSLETLPCHKDERSFVFAKKMPESCPDHSVPSVYFVFHDSGQVESAFFQIQQLGATRANSDWEHHKSYRDLIKNNTSTDFHTYRILWTQTVLAMYIDDIETHRVTDKNKIPDKPMYITMYGDGKRRTSQQVPLNNSVYMEIDYIILRNGTSTVSKIDIPLTISAVSGSIILFLVIVGAVLWFRNRQQRLVGRNMTRNEQNSPAANEIFKQLILRDLNATDSIRTKVDSLLHRYTELMNVHLDTIEIGDEILGEGEFGIVFKGLAHCLPTMVKGPTVVAIKALKSTDADQRARFAEELNIMAKLGRHVNIINILGMVLQKTPLLLLEYCPFGSLLSYLKARKPNCIQFDTDKAAGVPSIVYTKLQHESEDEQFELEENAGSNQLCTRDLIMFSHQISIGMEYLVSRSIIHRDLAARNILVSEDRILKISDFGLAKHGNNTYMVSNLLGTLPVFWMPPEAILTRTFSYKSDVWSFGVLLWEIFSFGQAPFDMPDVENFSASSFATWLMKGNQMERPNGTPLEMYEIMQHCWNLVPDHRPTFTELQNKLDQVLERTGGYRRYLPLQEELDTQLTQEYREYLESISEMTNELNE